MSYKFTGPLPEEEFQAKWDAAMAEAAKADQAAAMTPEDEAEGQKALDAWRAWLDHDASLKPGGAFEKADAEQRLRLEGALIATHGERPTVTPQDEAQALKEEVDERAAWLSAINGRPADARGRDLRGHTAGKPRDGWGGQR